MTVIRNAKKIREIVLIDQDLCDGCGKCVRGCAEGALVIEGGKARLAADLYCDGLGACLGECPRGAISIIAREAEDFEPGATGKSGGTGVQSKSVDFKLPGTVPVRGGAKAAGFDPPAPVSTVPNPAVRGMDAKGPKGLVNWPIRLRLVPATAPFLNAPVLTVAADCAAFACPDFHAVFLSSGHPILVDCPKFGDVERFIEKIGDILENNPSIRTVRVPIMEVPCCGGLARAVVKGAERSGREDVSIVSCSVGRNGTLTVEENP
ncbi:MAG: 4Fe-4S dicluster domain-containing protein [Deltaproteobacteria bacterium]|jgi:NAD-dependent dihydropyrimidine dehydrogenase PreA subunit|nr:4Fe-4S dicluster domain-containing protein [Deltaproteobacteria bacterium]